MQVQVAKEGGSEQHKWVTFLSRIALTLGAVLLAAGLVCFIAANWAQMTKTLRLGGVQAVLVVLAVAALALYPRCSKAAGVRQAVPAILLGLGGVAIGGLLAVIGQAYQTGADTWMLFGGWAVLMLPWAVAARAPGVWLLWCAIVNVAAVFWWGTRDNGPFSLFESGVPGVFLAGINLVLVAGWEFALRSKMARATVATRAMIGVLAAVGVVSVCAGVVTNDHMLSGEGRFALTLWAFVTLSAGAYYRFQRLDRGILALLALGAMAISVRLLGEFVWDWVDNAFSLLVMALIVVGESVLVARWLHGLRGPVAAEKPPVPVERNVDASAHPDTDRKAHADTLRRAGLNTDPNTAQDIDPVVDLGTDSSADPGADRSTDPGTDPVTDPSTPVAAPAAGHSWIVQGVLGLSAWVAMLLIAVFLVASGLVQSDAMARIVGACVTISGVVLLRVSHGAFLRQAAISAGVAGQVLLMTGLTLEHGFALSGAIMTAVSVVLILLSDDPVWRFVCGLVLATGIAFISFFGGGLPIFAVTILAWAGAATLLVTYRFNRPKLASLAWAFAISTHLVLWFGDYGNLFMSYGDFSERALAFVTLAYQACGLLPAVVALAIVTQRERALGSWLRIGLPLLMLAFAWPLSYAPGVGIAMAWVLAGFAFARPMWQVFGAAMVFAFLWRFYYDLNTPLLSKAYVLAATGAALWACGLAPTVWRRLRAPRPAATGATPAADSIDRYWRVAVLGGLGVILALTNASIYRYETILSTGRTMMLQLVPVDPRALMQGDFMALRFDVARQLEKARYRARANDASANPGTPPSLRPALDGYLVFELDRDGIAQLLRIQPDRTPLVAGEALLRYRIRNDQTYIVTNAFFFPEGMAKHYEAARFGELRVGADGTGLLVGMRDSDLNPL